MNKLTTALIACLLISSAQAQPPAAQIKLYSYQGDIRPYVQQCTDAYGYCGRENSVLPQVRTEFSTYDASSNAFLKTRTTYDYSGPAYHHECTLFERWTNGAGSRVNVCTDWGVTTTNRSVIDHLDVAERMAQGRAAITVPNPDQHMITTTECTISSRVKLFWCGAIPGASYTYRLYFVCISKAYDTNFALVQTGIVPSHNVKIVGAKVQNGDDYKPGYCYIDVAVSGGLSGIAGMDVTPFTPGSRAYFEYQFETPRLLDSSVRIEPTGLDK